MNQIIIIGNATGDAEGRVTPNGVNVCNFNVAVNDPYKKEEKPQYFRVIAWRKLGENCAKYVTKGSKVCVVGKVKLHTFQSKDGSSKSNMEIDADEVEFLSPKKQASPAPVDAETGYADVSADMNDDLPF